MPARELRTGAEVERVERDAVVLSAGERLAAGEVVVAAGAWSGALAGLPVRPVKGQLLRLRDPAGPGLVERVVRMDSSYLVPRGDGRYVLGATVEERGFEKAITALALHDLLRDTAEVVPGILELEVEEAIAGLRPGTPDNAPLLGRARADGPILATGHHRNGILLAPLTGELVAALAAARSRPRRPRPSPPLASPARRCRRDRGRQRQSRRGRSRRHGRGAARAAGAAGRRSRRGGGGRRRGRPRGEWSTRTVPDGARVEVLTAIQGG